jgi:single stranded DNA-binding protein
MTTIHLIGNLGKDCEVKEVNGKTVRVLSLAVNQKSKGSNLTAWYRISAWGNGYDKVSQYWVKGTALHIVGELMPINFYSDSNGNTKVQLDVRAMHITFVPSSNNKIKQSESLNSGSKAGTSKAEALNPNLDDDTCPF